MRRLAPVFLFFCLVAVSSPHNSYSGLSLSAVNQYGEPLPSVYFFLECESEKGDYAVEGKTQVCIGNLSGGCTSNPDGGCFGCENGKPAKIYARYFSDETSVEVPEWNGYSCAQDNYLSRSCCFLWRDYGLNTPKVAVPKFVFNLTSPSEPC